ncbi:MAG: alpha/beta fold hydrolase [Anaerolineales bacterium]|nr:alpha/beta fold hydrolase [Anaerolineales bacterium]
MTSQAIIKRAEPFYLPGGPVGCLVTHGFTGTPFEMRELGEFLNQHSYTVLGPRLAGHATKIEDMIRSTREDWLNSVEDGFHLLNSHCRQVFLIGLSMGGVLSLIQAARLPVDGVVALSTPYYFPVQWVQDNPWLLKLLSRFVKTQEKNEGNWFKPELAKDHISYERNPSRPAYELNLLLAEMRAALPQITVPALVIHSKDDNYVNEDHAVPLFEAIGSQEKDFIQVDQTSHVITRDGDTSRVFEPILAFLQKNTKKE